MLVKYDNMALKEDRRLIEAWRTVRIAALICEFGIENIMRWHGCATREEAWDVLLDHSNTVLVDRFSQVGFPAFLVALILHTQ